MAGVSGIIVPLVTPFTSDGRVDLKSLAWLVDKLAEIGVDGFFVGSTTGEYTRLERRELLALAGVALEFSRGKMVFAGVSSDNTDFSVKLGLVLRDLGVDGLVVTPPYFLRVSQDKLVLHFTEIASRTEIPIILYNIPSLVGYELSPATVARAAYESSNIVGVKATTYDLSYPRRVIRELESLGVKGFSVLTGLDDLLLPYLDLGASGGIVGLANAIPEIHVSLYRSWVNGDYSGALDNHRKLVKASSIYDSSSGIPCAAKAMLEARGAPVKALCRNPDGRESNEVITLAKSLLSELGVKPWT